MKQTKPQSSDSEEVGQASGNVVANGPGTQSGDSSQSPSSFVSPSTSSSGPSSEKPLEACYESESAIRKELRRLNRSLHSLSACNQALARAGSEQELLQQICDIMVSVGGYRMAGIAYAEQDEEKTVRPMAHAGHGSGYLETIQLKWSDTPPGRGPAGTAIRENRICVIADTEHDPQFAPWREAALAEGICGRDCAAVAVFGFTPSVCSPSIQSKWVLSRVPRWNCSRRWQTIWPMASRRCVRKRRPGGLQLR